MLSLCLLTSLLLTLNPQLAVSASAPEIVLLHVPPGWTAPKEGYFLDEAALQDLVAAANTYEAERNAWMQAYYELSEQAEEFRKSMQVQIAELKLGVAEERKAWKAALRKAKAPGVGVYAGFGYSGDGFEPSIGIGLTYKVWSW